MHSLISAAAPKVFERFRASSIHASLLLYSSAVICAWFRALTSSRWTSVAQVLNAVITFTRSAREWLTSRLSLYNERTLTEAFWLQTQKSRPLLRTALWLKTSETPQTGLDFLTRPEIEWGWKHNWKRQWSAQRKTKTIKSDAAKPSVQLMYYQELVTGVLLW